MKVITVARKPISGTIAQTALTHGTGGFNIDRSRLGTVDDLNGGAYGGDVRVRDNYSASDADAVVALTRLRNGVGVYAPPVGRWPANLIFQHHPECVKTGKQVVKGVDIVRYDTATAKQAYRFYTDREATSIPVATETQPDTLTDVFDCHPECPCVGLDAQSGVSSEPLRVTKTNEGRKNETSWRFKPTEGTLRGHGDSGGASRFFKQVGGKPIAEEG